MNESDIDVVKITFFSAYGKCEEECDVGRIGSNTILSEPSFRDKMVQKKVTDSAELSW